MLPKTSAYGKSYGVETNWTYFSIKDDELLDNCNGIWNIAYNIIKKELGCKPINYK